MACSIKIYKVKSSQCIVLPFMDKEICTEKYHKWPGNQVYVRYGKLKIVQYQQSSPPPHIDSQLYASYLYHLIQDVYCLEARR